MKDNCKTVFGDALLCSAAIVYLGPFPPQRRQELLEKWLSLCQGFEEALEPDDVAQTLKQKSVGVPPKNPLVPTSTPFRILTLLSCGSEQQEWDRDLKPQARSARLLGLLLRSHIYYRSYRWPLLLDPSNQALAWLNPLPQKQNMLLAPPKESRGRREYGIMLLGCLSSPALSTSYDLPFHGRDTEFLWLTHIFYQPE